MRNHILIDIDHCLSNATPRDHLLNAGDWDAYHSAAAHDLPNPDMVELINALNETGLATIGLSSRPEKWRSLTNQWLMAHEVKLDELILRPDDDYRPQADVKLSQALARFPDLLGSVMLVIDDREDVIERFAALGVTTLQARAT